METGETVRADGKVFVKSQVIDRGAKACDMEACNFHSACNDLSVSNLR